MLSSWDPKTKKNGTPEKSTSHHSSSCVFVLDSLAFDSLGSNTKHQFTVRKSATHMRSISPKNSDEVFTNETPAPNYANFTSFSANSLSHNFLKFSLFFLPMRQITIIIITLFYGMLHNARHDYQLQLVLEIHGLVFLDGLIFGSLTSVLHKFNNICRSDFSLNRDETSVKNVQISKDAFM